MKFNSSGARVLGNVQFFTQQCHNYYYNVVDQYDLQCTALCVIVINLLIIIKWNSNSNLDTHIINMPVG